MNDSKENTTIPSKPEKRLNLREELDEIKKVLHAHIYHFKQHEEREKIQLVKVMEKLDESCENTKGLVELWNATTGTIKVLSVAGSVIKWISGIAIGLGSLWILYNGNIPSGK